MAVTKNFVIGFDEDTVLSFAMPVDPVGFLAFLELRSTFARSTFIRINIPIPAAPVTVTSVTTTIPYDTIKDFYPKTSYKLVVESADGSTRIVAVEGLLNVY